MLVSDIITTAMEIIGALSIGQTPSSDDSTLVFNNLNAMLDGWNAERLNLYTSQPFTGNLTNGVQNYTMGPGGGYNRTAPIMIETASVIIPGSTVRRPVSVLNAEQWANLTEKGLTGFLPDKLYCDYLWPISNIAVHPIPNQTIVIELYLRYILAQFVTTGDTVSFPPGYVEALQYNLAVKIAPQFGLAQDPTNLQLAASYKQKMQQYNTLTGFPVPPMQQAALPQQQAGSPPAQAAQ